MYKNRLKRLEAKHAGLKAPGLGLILKRDKSFTIDGKPYSAHTPWPAEVVGIFPETIENLEEWEKCVKDKTPFFLDRTNWDPETLESLKKGKS